MDPTAACARIKEALTSEDHAEVFSSALDLANWLLHLGFLPTDPASDPIADVLQAIDDADASPGSTHWRVTLLSGARSALELALQVRGMWLHYHPRTGAWPGEEYRRIMLSQLNLAGRMVAAEKRKKKIPQKEST